MQSWEDWLNYTGDRIIDTIKKQKPGLNVNYEIAVVKSLLHDYFKLQMNSNEENIGLTNGCINALITNSIGAAKLHKKEFVVALMSQVLMKRRPGLKINFKGIIDHLSYFDITKDITMQLKNYIYFPPNDSDRLRYDPKIKKQWI